MPLQPATLDKFAEALKALAPEDAQAVFERLGGDPEALADPEPVTAAATGAVQKMARAAGKPTPSPEAGARGRTALVASANAIGARQGDPFEDKWALAESMALTLNGLGSSWHGKCIVASADWRGQYPEARKLNDSPTDAERKMDAVTGLQALVATGGLCAPVNVDYSLPTFATPDTPIRDGLPSFEATRGGIRYIVPPDIAEWAEASGVWTEATDLEPAGATKPVKAMACGEEKHVYISAVSTRIGFGNMQGRFAPEQVAANTDLAFAAAARKAENYLLELLEETALKDVTTAKVLGGFRDLLSAIDVAGANYRQTHRIPSETMLTVVLPEWVKVMAKEDMAREQAHAQSSDWNSLAVTDAQIEDILEVHRVRPIWHLDGLGEPSSKHYPAQTFVAAAEASAIKKYPEKVAWTMFVEGSVQFLDGGRLDLGVVRDSTLDATNDFESFSEVFIGLAQRGFVNSVVQFVSTLCPSGGSSATVTAECP